ncbi:MAG: porin [Alphaproteobacteria bacterium]|nr:porin [Alphaproteobacteria bacterium]
MKKTLLASTALIGAALLTAPAHAGTVGSGDNLAVRLSGFMWFQVNVIDEDISAGNGRGFDFDIPETELHINASNTADNGIKYGVSIEMEVNTDASNNGDEVWAFLSGDFGRVEMGDQDDATNRMLVGAFQAHQGICGPFGGLGCLAPVFQSGGGEPFTIARTDWQVATSSDATKVTYFSPRFSGFQVGASFTPDSGGNGASFGETDNDGDYEKMMGLGLNYTGKFDDFGISASVLYETATDEDTINGGETFEDLEFIYVGAKVDFAGFTVGANYRDNGDTGLSKSATAAGADHGHYWAVAAGYKMGPWGVSAWYSYGERDPLGSGSSSFATEEMVRYGLGGRYAIAPGWQLRADLSFLEWENRGGTPSSTSNPDQDSTAFILTNMINF